MQLYRIHCKGVQGKINHIECECNYITTVDFFLVGVGKITNIPYQGATVNTCGFSTEYFSPTQLWRTQRTQLWKFGFGVLPSVMLR